MESREGPKRLTAYRAHARRLLKQLRSGNPAESATARERFLRLRSFSGTAGPEFAHDRDRVRLKHALAVIAQESGYASWGALKAALESAAPRSESWYARGMDAFLNRWFSSYEEARASLEAEGGYLLPYRSQFFVCGADAIRLLGLDPADPDWERIGCDCVRPADQEACVRLRDRRRADAWDVPASSGDRNAVSEIESSSAKQRRSRPA